MDHASRYTEDYGPNVTSILVRGTRIVRGKIPMSVRRELQAAVKCGVLGRLPKQGLSPEVFFHPDSRHTAIGLAKNEQIASIDSIKRVCVGGDDLAASRFR